MAAGLYTGPIPQSVLTAEPAPPPAAPGPDDLQNPGLLQRLNLRGTVDNMNLAAQVATNVAAAWRMIDTAAQALAVTPAKTVDEAAGQVQTFEEIADAVAKSASDTKTAMQNFDDVKAGVDNAQLMGDEAARLVSLANRVKDTDVEKARVALIGAEQFNDVSKTLLNVANGATDAYQKLFQAWELQKRSVEAAGARVSGSLANVRALVNAEAYKQMDDLLRETLDRARNGNADAGDALAQFAKKVGDILIMAVAGVAIVGVLAAAFVAFSFARKRA